GRGGDGAQPADAGEGRARSGGRAALAAPGGRDRARLRAAQHRGRERRAGRPGQGRRVSRVEVEVSIQNALGLHLRAAAAFARAAEACGSDVTMARDALSANGKSIISLVTLAAPRGTRVRIIAEGADADAAVKALSELVEQKFGESS